MTLDIWHRYLICYTWHLIHDTWYLTPVLDILSLDTWYLTLDIWHRYLICYHLTPDTWHLISDTGTWHVITWHLTPDTWCLTLVLDMLSLDTWCLTLDIWHRYLTCYTWHLILDTWYLTLVLDMIYLTPDTWYMTLDMLSHSTSTLDLILWHLTVYYHTWHLYYFAYSWLSLLRGLDMIIILLQDIWYSCAPELLYSWTPVTGRLLILFSWCHTPVDPRNWLIMDIGLLWTPCGYYHWAIYNKVFNLHWDGKNWWILSVGMYI